VTALILQAMRPIWAPMTAVIACAASVLAADQRLALVSAVDQDGTPLVAIDAADYIVEEGTTACDGPARRAS